MKKIFIKIMKEMFIEIMTHIITIENILIVNYNLSDKAMNECIKKNRDYIREQLK